VHGLPHGIQRLKSLGLRRRQQGIQHAHKSDLDTSEHVARSYGCGNLYGFGPAQPGAVQQLARAFHDGKEVANLDLTIALGAPQPRDEIELEGEPGIRVLIPGGTQGDKATCWTVVHAAPLVQGSEPGLISVLDLPAGR